MEKGSIVNLLPYIIVLIAAILWGTTGKLQTYLQEGISPISVAEYYCQY